MSGWELWGRAEVLLGGMRVFNYGEQDRAFSLPKRMLQKFEMCRWHRICERTFVSDESPYLGVLSYFLTINSGAELTSLGSLRACSSQPGGPIEKPLPMNVKIVFLLGASNSSSC